MCVWRMAADPMNRPDININAETNNKTHAVTFSTISCSMALRTTSIAGWVDVNRAARGSERRWQGTKRTQKSSKVVAAPRTGRCTHKGRNTQMAAASNATRHQRSFSNAATRFGGKPFLFAKIL